MQLIKGGKYQNRLAVTVLGGIVIIMLAWNGALKKTKAAYLGISKMNNIIGSIDQTNMEKKLLLGDIERLNAALGIGVKKMQQESVFEELVTACKKIDNVQILNFPDIHQINMNGYRITTLFASLEGSYSDLLILLYNLEKNKKIGRLVSADFKKKIDIKTRKEYLSLTILLQNYELISQ